MAVTRLRPPPINVTADDFTFKKWFDDAYRWSEGGVLIPVGGSNDPTTVPTIRGQNFITNGNMDIWQRGTSFTFASATDYSADRWHIFPNNASTVVITRQSSGLNGFRYCMRAQHTAVLNSQTLISQSLETRDSLPLAGQLVTMSFWMRIGSGFNGTVQALVATGTSTDGNVILGPWAGSSNVFLANVPVTSSWKFFQYSGVIPSTANQIAFYFSVIHTANPITANDYFEITGLQLETGPRATAFSQIPFEQQLRRCQRYYNKSFLYDQPPIYNIGTANEAVLYYASNAGALPKVTPVYYPVRMRATPATTFYNVSAVNGNWRNTGIPADSGAAAAFGASEDKMYIYNPQVAGDAIGNLFAVHYSSVSEL
jgi:hypothetical protein